MKKQNKSIIEKTIRVVAKASGETSSWFAFYEPKLPEKLIKKDKDKE
ncbi:MAG: cyclic lactone autoinducer peptide [Lachnospiraceae bacterium]|nr:cyclic lactone autoinducer peptide [Lachnospiraceae bacterium]